MTNNDLFVILNLGWYTIEIDWKAGAPPYTNYFSTNTKCKTIKSLVSYLCP